MRANTTLLNLHRLIYRKYTLKNDIAMKKQSFILTIFSLFIFGIGLVACDKEEERGNPTLQLEFNTVTSEANLKTALANNLQFSSGHIILESIEFEAESDVDSLEMEFEIESYITIDFATGDSNPDISCHRG